MERINNFQTPEREGGGSDFELPSVRQLATGAFLATILAACAAKKEPDLGIGINDTITADTFDKDQLKIDVASKMGRELDLTIALSAMKRLIDTLPVILEVKEENEIIPAGDPAEEPLYVQLQYAIMAYMDNGGDQREVVAINEKYREARINHYVEILARQNEKTKRLQGDALKGNLGANEYQDSAERAKTIERRIDELKKYQFTVYSPNEERNPELNPYTFEVSSYVAFARKSGISPELQIEELDKMEERFKEKQKDFGIAPVGKVDDFSDEDVSKMFASAPTSGDAKVSKETALEADLSMALVELAEHRLYLQKVIEISYYQYDEVGSTGISTGEDDPLAELPETSMAGVSITDVATLGEPKAEYPAFDYTKIDEKGPVYIIKFRREFLKAAFARYDLELRAYHSWGHQEDFRPLFLWNKVLAETAEEMGNLDDKVVTASIVADASGNKKVAMNAPIGTKEFVETYLKTINGARDRAQAFRSDSLEVLSRLTEVDSFAVADEAYMPESLRPLSNKVREVEAVQQAIDVPCYTQPDYIFTNPWGEAIARFDWGGTSLPSYICTAMADSIYRDPIAGPAEGLYSVIPIDRQDEGYRAAVETPNPHLAVNLLPTQGKGGIQEVVNRIATAAVISGEVKPEKERVQKQPKVKVEQAESTAAAVEE